MKFSQKIFLSTFAFITISINLIGIIIINNNYQIQLNAKMENSSANIRNISDKLKFYDVYSLNLPKDKNTNYEISTDNEIIYTNLLSDKNKIKDKIVPTENSIKSIIMDGTIYTSTKTQEGYNIILAQDMSEIYNIRTEQIHFFVRVSIIASFTVAFALYIITFFLTKKLKKLDKTVEEISKGKYFARVKYLGTDEVGSLATSFNKMAISVEDNINEINRVSENRQNFIDNLTHEIRTPLTSIIGYSSLIKNGEIEEKEKIIECNNKIYEEGKYLNLISQKLVDIVLLDNKKISLEKIDVSIEITKIIKDIKQNYRDVKFIEQIEQDIIFASDEVLLHSLILNIVKNAIAAYELENEKIVWIIFKQINANHVLLQIVDQGKGMTEEQLNKVMEPFYTLNKDRNREKCGIGLGLTLCKKTCEVLNAEMKIESKKGYGTSISIEFAT